MNTNNDDFADRNVTEDVRGKIAVTRRRIAKLEQMRESMERNALLAQEISRLASYEGLLAQDKKQDDSIRQTTSETPVVEPVVTKPDEPSQATNTSATATYVDPTEPNLVPIFNSVGRFFRRLRSFMSSSALRLFFSWFGLGTVFFFLFSLFMLSLCELVAANTRYHHHDRTLGIIGTSVCGGLCVGLVLLGVIKARKDRGRLRENEDRRDTGRQSDACQTPAQGRSEIHKTTQPTVQPTANSLPNLPTALPMAWFYFWTYFRLPLGAAWGMIQVAGEQGGPFFPQAIWGLGAIVVAVGLHLRRLWAWKANWVYVIGEPVIWILYAFDLKDGLAMALIALFVEALIAYLAWVLPNGIYFEKRKALFQ